MAMVAACWLPGGARGLAIRGIGYASGPFHRGLRPHCSLCCRQRAASGLESLFLRNARNERLTFAVTAL